MEFDVIVVYRDDGWNWVQPSLARKGERAPNVIRRADLRRRAIAVRRAGHRVTLKMGDDGRGAEAFGVCCGPRVQPAAARGRLSARTPGGGFALVGFLSVEVS